jgi:hypothetical protein
MCYGHSPCVACMVCGRELTGLRYVRSDAGITTELADVQLARADEAIEQNEFAHRFPFFFGLHGYSVLDWMELPPQLPAWNLATVCQARPSTKHNVAVYLHVCKRAHGRRGNSATMSRAIHVSIQSARVQMALTRAVHLTLGDELPASAARAMSCVHPRTVWIASARGAVLQLSECGQRFSIACWRHHCRNCGISVCAKHSSKPRLGLLEGGRDIPDAEKSRGENARVCDRCWHRTKKRKPPGTIPDCVVRIMLKCDVRLLHPTSGRT